MNYHATALQIGLDRRGEIRNRKPKPDNPELAYKSVEWWFVRRFRRIDKYFAAVARGEPSGDLLADALVEERGISVGSTANK